MKSVVQRLDHRVLYLIHHLQSVQVYLHFHQVTQICQNKRFERVLDTQFVVLYKVA